jgi:hypothetical protein
VARRAVNLHGCAPVSRGPFPQIPAFEGRCIPAGFVALPRRTAAGTPRSGASPVGAHRPSRCTASSATDPGRPASLRPHSFGLLRFPTHTKWRAANVRQLARVTVTRDPRRCGGIDEAGGHSYFEWSVGECPAKKVRITSSGTGSERAQGRELRLRGPLREPGALSRRQRSARGSPRFGGGHHTRCAPWHREARTEPLSGHRGHS